MVRPTLTALSLRFLRLGALAWGGPVVQIAALHEEFVQRERWIDAERFRKALALYQALPGPEATEMCIWIGTTARGRIGGVLAGLGFVLPGLSLMLLASWLLFGIDPWPPWLLATFVGLQAAVVALVARAAWRLFGVAAGTDPRRQAIALGAALGAIAGVPFAVSLVAGGLVATARSRAVVAGIACVWLAVGALLHDSSPIALPAAHAAAPTAGAMLLGGLRAGLLTFGGAYAAIPFLRGDAVGGGWMTDAQFLSGLAVGGVIPAPMVIVGTWVGWAGGGPGGALLVTLGIFLPAFVLPLLVHAHLARIVANARCHAFLDGVTAAVVGLVAIVAIAMVGTLASPLRAAIALGALAVLTLLRGRFVVLPVMAAAALAGRLLA